MFAFWKSTFANAIQNLSSYMKSFLETVARDMQMSAYRHSHNDNVNVLIAFVMNIMFTNLVTHVSILASANSYQVLDHNLKHQTK